MKKTLIIITALYALVFYSCDVPLNPNAPFRQRYVLTGIMRNDTSLQVVTLTKSYQPSDGLNPKSNTQDPAVIGAEVNIWYRDTLYELRDSTAIRTDTSQYKDSVHFYYAKNLRPATGEYVDIEALLPNGLLLQSTTQLPAIPQFNFIDDESDHGISPSIPNGIFHVKWKAVPGVFYQTRVVIDYYVKGSSVMQTKVVPLFYITQNGNRTAVYPSQTKINFFDIDTSVINQALNEIPQAGLSKSNYTIANIDVQIIIYDDILSTYFASIQQGVDAFTVQLDKPDYSNIQGGYGVFGSYLRTDFFVNFTASYLISLGYFP
jgi:hypothetical protein